MHVNFMYVFNYFSANWIKFHGIKYQIPFGLVVDKSEDEEDLIFGDVKNIFVADSCSVIFEFEELESEYIHHYHAFALLLPPVPSRKRYLIKHSDLLSFQPLGLYHCNSVSDNSLLRFAVPRSNMYK